MIIHNFSAGPSILPKEVIKKAAEAVINFNNSGVSILEISHRSSAFEEVIEKSRRYVKELMELDDTYEVLFLQGGASLGFYMAPLNFLTSQGTAGYIDTGTWANKAIKEAKLVGQVNVLGSSEHSNYSYIPKIKDIPSNLDYLHITSNNTIFGSQYHSFPKTDTPLICDMSSDIFSRKIKFSDFTLIYAGAQKNMGPAGATLYVVKKDALGKTGRKIPSMLDFQVHIKGESMYNTPPVYSIYVSMLTLEWIKNLGGLEKIEQINKAKAKLLYDEIDQNSLFKGTVQVEDRSLMNVTFLLTNESLQTEFDKMWFDAGIREIKGHRSVGGYRASIYNAMPIESVQVLVDIMKQLEKKHG